MGGKRSKVVFGTVTSKREERKMTVSAHDVVAYILQKQGPMTAMKLQKLLYYCQAWSLVWDEIPLFEEEIQAWANGPIVPLIYKDHQGKFRVESWDYGDSSRLTSTQKKTVDAVLAYYGDKSAQWLSDLTHAEAPWNLARKGLAPGERGNAIISHASMDEYYSSLLPEQ